MSRWHRNAPVTVRGERYTFRELSHEYGISYNTLIGRYQKGYRDDRLVEPVEQPHIRIRGQVYTLGELSREYRIPRNTLDYRYRQGIRGEELTRPPQQKSHFVSVDGKRYTLYGLARHYHIENSTVVNRYHQGIRGRELVVPTKYQERERLPARVMLDGEPYTFPELSRRYDIKMVTLRDRYHKGDRQHALVRPTRSHRQHVLRTILVQGHHYTFTGLSQATHISRGTLYRRYHRGERDATLIRPTRKTQHVQLEGKEYTLPELSQAFGINLATIWNRYRRGWRGKKLMRPSIQMVTYRGKKYTYQELSQLSGVSVQTLHYRYARQHLRGDALIQPY